MVEIPTWLFIVLNAAYASNAVLAVLGYIPQLSSLWQVYKLGKSSRDVSIRAFSLWSLGALFTTLYGVLIVNSWLMALVGFITLFLNIAVIFLVYLSRKQTGESDEFC